MAIYAFLQETDEQFVFGKPPQSAALYLGARGRKVIFGRDDHARDLGQPPAIHASGTKRGQCGRFAVAPLTAQSVPSDKFDKGNNVFYAPGRHTKCQAEFRKRFFFAPHLFEHPCSGNSERCQAGGEFTGPIRQSQSFIGFSTCKIDAGQGVVDKRLIGLRRQ